MEAIILLGAPGAGKGTLAETVKTRHGYLHVSTGDMLREAVKAGRPAGLEARAYMERGALVPDEIILRLVRERLDAGGPDGRFLFDGFPRTTRQAGLLDDELRRSGGRVTHVFLLTVAREVLVRRICGRRVCRACGAVFNVDTMPPRRAGVCDACGGELYQRPDDNEATLLNRLDVFEKQTADLIVHYEAQGILHRVDSTQRAPAEAAIGARLGGKPA